MALTNPNRKSQKNSFRKISTLLFGTWSVIVFCSTISEKKFQIFYQVLSRQKKSKLVNELDDDGKSPIYYAAKKEDLPMMEELLNHSCKLTKDSVLHLARKRKENGLVNKV